MANSPKIVLLCSDGPSTRAVCGALVKTFGNVTVVLEEPMSRIDMARRRARKLGYVTAAGQVVFALLAVRALRAVSGARIAEINREFSMDEDWATDDIVRVASVNSDEAREALQALAPDLVVVNGTRIIGRKTLQSVDAKFINMHAGITPTYRGVHGAYWALAEGRPEHVGTTVHFVDEGIDTGNIIGQAFFAPIASDNFVTYPYLHTAHGIPLLLDAVRRHFDGTLTARTEPPPSTESRLRYHPTLGQYMFYRLAKGVR